MKLLFILLLFQWGFADPTALYLTWKEDPTTSMVIKWHTESSDHLSTVFYKKSKDSNWEKIQGSYKALLKELAIHTVELRGLQPGTEYIFRLSPSTKEYLFRTMPTHLDQRSIRFAVGGDLYFYTTLFRRMNYQVASQQPDFVVLGGDLAYTLRHKGFFKGNHWEIRRLKTFFEEWSRAMILTDGRLIPFIPVIGNHDYKQKAMNALSVLEWFNDFFSFPTDQITYRHFDFGNYLRLFLLDTGHVHPIDGTQTEWLEKTLHEESPVFHKIAVYHVAAYPSVYKFTGSTPSKIRRLWSPLFEKYGVSFAFEHHNHAYKRTFPIKNEQMDPEGVIYLGDGSWGVEPRLPKEKWYLARAEGTNAFFFITLEESQISIQAIDNKGLVIDFHRQKAFKVNIDNNSLN